MSSIVNENVIADSNHPIKPSQKRLENLKTRRKLWLNAHLYLGLVIGLFLSVVGLTGSLLVFYQESQDFLHPELFITAKSHNASIPLQSLDKMLSAAEKAKPPHSRFSKVYYPRHDKLAYRFFYNVYDEKGGKGDGYNVFVDPYTLKVNGTQIWLPKDRDLVRPLPSFIMQLHWCLLLGRDTGRIAVGILAILGFISVLTGLIVWYPLTGKFKQALTIKHPASGIRRIFDLHKTTGFYLSFMMLPILLSGVCMNLTEQVNIVANVFSPLNRPDVFDSISSEIQSHPQEENFKINLAQVEKTVQQHSPSGDLWMLNSPQNAKGVFVVKKRNVDEVGRFIGYRDFAIDQYSGKILKVYNAGTGSAADIFMDWQWPLHSGQAFGWTGRILVFLSGLACPILFVTGFIRWRQKSAVAKAKLNR